MIDRKDLIYVMTGISPEDQQVRELAERRRIIAKEAKPQIILIDGEPLSVEMQSAFADMELDVNHSYPTKGSASRIVKLLVDRGFAASMVDKA